jgi:hypothetical protein
VLGDNRMQRMLMTGFGKSHDLLGVERQLCGIPVIIPADWKCPTFPKTDIPAPCGHDRKVLEVDVIGSDNCRLPTTHSGCTSFRNIPNLYLSSFHNSEFVVGKYNF